MTVLAAACGMTVAVGVVMVLWALVPASGTQDDQDDPEGRPPSSAARRARRVRGRYTRRDKIAYAVAVVIGLIIALTTGWLAAVVVAPLAVWIAPRVWLSKDGSDVELLEALQEWSLRLSSLIGAGHHLTEALGASLRSCPDRIRPQVQLLVARMQAGQSPQAALYSFADDVDDATGDRLADALIHASRHDAGPLRHILADAAAMIEQEVAGRRAVTQAQSGPRSEGRWVSLVLFGTLAALMLYPATGAFYRSPAGSLFLVALLLGAAACLAWIRQIITPIRPARWLIRPKGVR